MNNPKRLLVFSSALITGYVVMAFEMLIGNYLNPYFGSSIVTWGAIISTVLAALGLGYFLGGRLADRCPSGSAIGWLLCGVAGYLAAIPAGADAALLYIATNVSDSRLGALSAASLFAIPLLPLGMYVPFAVRMTLRDKEHSGTGSGMVYGISTIGSIAGTLSVAFFLVMYMGSRHITDALAIIILIVGLLNLRMLRLDRQETRQNEITLRV